MLNVNLDKCTGCGLCVRACPYSAIEIKNRKAKVLDNCTLCGACVKVCPVGALEVDKERKKPLVDINLYKGVWIIAEQKKAEYRR